MQYIKFDFWQAPATDSVGGTTEQPKQTMGVGAIIGICVGGAVVLVAVGGFVFLKIKGLSLQDVFAKPTKKNEETLDETKEEADND